VRAVIAGGGTAGHVFPALAVADVLRGRDVDVTFVGASDGQEAELVPKAGYPFVPLRVASAQTRVSVHTLRAAGLSLAATRTCRSAVAAAGVVVGIGGFASAPAAFAARLARTPLVLIEPNSVPGAVNRLAARWARVVATTFESTAARLPRGARTVRTGNPVRAAIRAVPAHRAQLRDEATAVLGLEVGRTTILVVGGSQGARRIDEVVAASIPRLRDRGDLQLLIATGRDHLHLIDAVLSDAGALLVRATGFIERMDLAIAAADVAVARAGAGTICELMIGEVPVVLVPYPYATEHHQDANAAEVVAAGGATLIPEQQLSPDRLTERILALVDDEPRRKRMAEAARAWARPDAAEQIAALALEVARP
jgi:UDP-N-acetylglucosamine--N-acetylmuramyl-(pentapeptide) pyrophosphoryl-undecaprenol N-acetylglucosamine transferase